jgi:hypothetical protein
MKTVRRASVAATVIAIAAAMTIISACSNGGPLSTQPPDPTPSLRVTPDVDTVFVGDTARFYVSSRDSQPASWTVSDSRVAQIENRGGGSAWVHGLHSGTTTVTAVVGDRTASGALVVNGSKLAFTVQPSSASAGAALAPAIVVTIEDPSGHPLTGATNDVTVAIDSPTAGGTLSGTTTVTAVNGVATFGNLSIQKAGTGYILSASSGGSLRTTSVPFAITPAASAQLAFTVQPSGTGEAHAFTPAVQVAIEDAFANVVPSATDVVTIAIGTNPSGGMLAGTTTMNAVSGIATFANLAIDRPGAGYTLAASAPGLAGAASRAFTIIVGPASIIVVSGQGQIIRNGCPPVPLVVQVNDPTNQPLAGVQVRWSLGGLTTTTGMNGQTSVSWQVSWQPPVRLGAIDTATVTNVGSVIFHASIDIWHLGCVHPPPTIGLSPSSLMFAATQGGANPAAQTVWVTNAGPGTLSGLAVGTITYVTDTLRPTPTPTGWLSASLGGSTAPATLTLNATTGTLPPGTYAAYVPVTSTVASSQAVAVTLTVQ